MVLLVFDLMMTVGVGFLVYCLRQFVRDVRPRHAASPESVRKMGLQRAGTRPRGVLYPTRLPVDFVRRHR